MTDTDAEVDELLRTASAVLERRLGSRVVLGDPVDLGGSGRARVLRVRVEPHPFLTSRTLVLKRRTPDERREDATAFLREAASYQFTTALDPASRPGPELIAIGVDERLLVLEDLGAARTLDALPTADSAQRRVALAALGQALGRMHAATEGRQEDFETLLGRLASARGSGRVRGAGELATEELDSAARLFAERFGIDTPEPVLDFVRMVGDMLAPSPANVFSPSELHPENILVTGDGVKVLDFEWAGFRDPAFDIACVLQGFPTAPSEHRLVVDAADETAFLDAWHGEACHGPGGVHGGRHRSRHKEERHGEMRRRLLAARLSWTWVPFWYRMRGATDEFVADLSRSRRAFTDLADAAERAGEPALREHSSRVAAALA